jgi:hypothetical protein
MGFLTKKYQFLLGDITQKGEMVKLLDKCIVRINKSKGYCDYAAKKKFKEQYQDIFQNKNTTLKEKFWAQKRGFLSGKIAFYGLTEDNYRDYLAEFDYWKMYPINGIYSKWIDDKLTTKLILRPFSEYLPEYYYQVGNDEVLKLMDCPPDYGQSIEDLVILLREKRFLAAKLMEGTLGEGFYKLSFDGKKYYKNNQDISEEDLWKLFDSWKGLKTGGYLVTEYLHTHRELGKIWNETPNKLRIMVIREKNKPAIIGDAFFSFGTSKTGVIDNASAGGVACSVDLQTGELSRPVNLHNKKLIASEYHPDTNVRVSGILPHWELITKTLGEISEYLPQIRYMGYDIAITDGGFKIIEINTNQGYTYLQYFCPAFKNPLVADFFTGLLDKQ